MTALANAKINLYLDIIGRREDGYHLLETVMQSVGLYDIVEVSFADGKGIVLSCDDPNIPSDERNIAYKAAQRYLEAADVDALVVIDIKKRIPSGAGMGGGSADAAAVLLMMERHFKALGMERLTELAATLGADVPFCLTGGTKVCTGIGDIMRDAHRVSGCCFLVVMPDFTCPTGAAYSRYDEAPIPARNALAEFECSLAGGFEKKLYNSFEVLYGDPRIDNIISRLISSGADGALLTGSGAAVFGVFTDGAAAQAAAAGFPEYFTAVCRPEPVGIIIPCQQDQKEAVI